MCSNFRGKVEIAFVKDIHSVGGCDLSREDCFFSCLSFNHESSRLAAVQGEIRVGNAEQIRIYLGVKCSESHPTTKFYLLIDPLHSKQPNGGRGYLLALRVLMMRAAAGLGQGQGWKAGIDLPENEKETDADAKTEHREEGGNYPHKC
ncbi:hypothetical protein WR25_16682 [Diploscapter pachys]|uniref:Uncharacterized protein n=1 Tax=Diploscapter pachys TaxID=2018661 RepID=A0A2A2LUF1_9BILA|nr:hypothetical protein WR25_16682 [Diploscapter pachys]